MLERPVQGEWTAAEKHQHNGLPRCDSFFQQLLLASRQAKVCARSGLAGHPRCIFYQRDNHDIGLLRRSDSIGDLVIGSSDDFSSLRVAKAIDSEFLCERSAKRDDVLSAASGSPGAQHILLIIGQRSNQSYGPRFRGKRQNWRSIRASSILQKNERLLRCGACQRQALWLEHGRRFLRLVTV